MVEDSTTRSLRLELRAGSGLIVPGVANALSARIAQQAGHRIVMVSGAAIANSYLGMPDVGLVSVSELVDHVAAVREAVSIPIIADADTGFGNALNVRRTIRQLEAAGADGVMIEDQTAPKRCGHFDGKSVVSTSEMIGKIKAAVDARETPELFILARTDALGVEGFDAALARAGAYREAGADGLFIEAPMTSEELLSIPRLCPGLHFCNMVVGGKSPLLPREQLAEAGYAAIGYANAGLQAAMLAMQRMMKHLHEHGSVAGAEDQLLMFKDRQAVLGTAMFRELELRYA